MKILEELLPGAYLINPFSQYDLRGKFVKTYHADDFLQLGLQFTPLEDFFSVSKLGVLRGMHFQAPPNDHSKLVSCLNGRILDVLLDLREGPTYGLTASIELSDKNNYLIYVPHGVAHGFMTLTDNSIVSYKTSNIHSAVSDSGIQWSSFGFNWGNSNPILSLRDSSHINFSEFKTPFLL